MIGLLSEEVQGRYKCGDNRGFMITLFGMGIEACIEFATHNWQTIDAIAVSAGRAAHDVNAEEGLENCYGVDSGDGVLLGCPNSEKYLCHYH